MEVARLDLKKFNPSRIWLKMDWNGETKFIQPTPTQLEQGFDDDDDDDKGDYRK